MSIDWTFSVQSVQLVGRGVGLEMAWLDGFQTFLWFNKFINNGLWALWVRFDDVGMGIALF